MADVEAIRLYVSLSETVLHKRHVWLFSVVFSFLSQSTAGYLEDLLVLFCLFSE